MGITLRVLYFLDDGQSVKNIIFMFLKVATACITLLSFSLLARMFSNKEDVKIMFFTLGCLKLLFPNPC
jgi:hypothetical protein